MALHIEALQISVFLAAASLFLFLSARFCLDENSATKALITIMVVTSIAGILYLLSLPSLVSLLALLVTGLITVQAVYDTDTKNAALVIIVYVAVSTIVGVVIQGIIYLLSL